MYIFHETRCPLYIRGSSCNCVNVCLHVLQYFSPPKFLECKQSAAPRSRGCRALSEAQILLIVSVLRFARLIGKLANRISVCVSSLINVVTGINNSDQLPYLNLAERKQRRKFMQSLPRSLISDVSPISC